MENRMRVRLVLFIAVLFIACSVDKCGCIHQPELVSVILESRALGETKVWADGQIVAMFQTDGHVDTVVVDDGAGLHARITRNGFIRTLDTVATDGLEWGIE